MVEKGVIYSLNIFFLLVERTTVSWNFKKPMCIFKSITTSSLIQPYLPFENQVPCVQKETVELQTNLMNNPAEFLFKLDSDCEMYGGKLGVQPQKSSEETNQCV